MALKVEAKGGKGRNQWDDGFDHEGVTKVYVRGGFEGIQFIKFEYVKAGKTIVGPIHGVSGRGMTQTFEINHSDKEYVLSVDGYYDQSTGVIQSIEFKTNKKTSDIMGFNDGTKFSLSAPGKKIIGFHGSSEKHLNSLGAYFINLPPMKSEVEGAKNTGNIFDDGGDYDGVRKVYVSYDTKIRHIKFDYDKAGQVVSREHGAKNSGTQYEFKIDYPSEYLTYVEGTYALTEPYQTDILHSLTFKTSKGRTSPVIGRPAGSFVLQSEGNAIVGFHGRCGGSVDGVGAYYSPLHSSPLEKLKALGGEGGNQWDDGFDNENVTKIHVRAGLQGIQFIKFEYFKAGKTIVGPIHGVSGRGMTQTFEIDHLDTEYLLSVEGYYDESTGVIQSIQFKTNKKDSDLMGFNPGVKFSLKATGKKIIGFHGFSGENLNSLGAYFIKHPPIKSEIGGAINTGNIFDDGGDYDGVRKVYVSYDTKIRHIMFDYDKAGKVVSREHGAKNSGTQYEFKVDYPSEHITSVEGTYAITHPYETHILRSLTFKTSKGRTSPVIGRPAGSFVLGSEGNAIVGFHGRCGGSVDGLGAYYSPLPLEKLEEQGGEGENFPLPPTPLIPSFKLPAKGGNGGDSWDDGEHDNVRKVYVGQGDSGVAFVKFDYNKGSELLAGDGHGKKSLLGTEEVINYNSWLRSSDFKDMKYDPYARPNNSTDIFKFEVDPDDYITSVQVYYDKIFGLDTEIITALIFKTFKGIISQPFGMTSGDMFLLEGGKITGFHGTSRDVLHSIGAYMSLSPTPMLRGKWIQVEQKGKGPGPRCSHAISMVGDKMYSFGGELTPNFHIDKHLYVFDFKTHTWSIATSNGSDPDLPCLGVCMVAIGTTLYVFGGRDGHRNYSGFYSYDTVKSEWKLLTHVNKGPEPRSFHSMASDDENVYVFGGVSKTARLNTLHAYNIKDQKWIELPNPGDSCKARGGPGLAVVQGKIWVVYGFSGVAMDDVHCFDPVENKWTKMETKGEKPWARSVFAIAVLGKYIIMSGGETEMDPKAHLGPGKLTSAAFLLDTESLMWEKLEEGHSPRGWCASTTALIDGKKGLLMYGGKSLTNDRYEDILFYGVDSA